MHLRKFGSSQENVSSGQDETDESPIEDVETSGLKPVAASPADAASATQEQAAS